MDERTARELRRGAAKTIYSIGIFLLIAAGWGYIAAANDPVHDDGKQLPMAIIGAVLAFAGRTLRQRWT